MRFSSKKKVFVKFEKQEKGDESQLTLHDSRIQVRESMLYFGFINDKRDSWGHANDLGAQCIPTVVVT